MNEKVNIDELISQLEELAHTELHTRAAELRRIIQMKVDILLKDEPSSNKSHENGRALAVAR